MVVPVAIQWLRTQRSEPELLDQIVASEGQMPRVDELRQVPAMSILNDDAPNIGDYPRN